MRFTTWSRSEMQWRGREGHSVIVEGLKEEWFMSALHVGQQDYGSSRSSELWVTYSAPSAPADGGALLAKKWCVSARCAALR